MTKPSSELIREMQEEATRHGLDVVCIAVGFDQEARFVFSSERDPQKRLEQSIDDGGEPLGFIGCRQPPKGQTAIQFHIRPFDEYAGEDWVQDYLRELSQLMEQKFLRLEGIAGRST
jgi:hypothetical protein